MLSAAYYLKDYEVPQHVWVTGTMVHTRGQFSIPLSKKHGYILSIGLVWFLFLRAKRTVKLEYLIVSHSGSAAN